MKTAYRHCFRKLQLKVIVLFTHWPKRLQLTGSRMLPFIWGLQNVPSTLSQPRRFSTKRTPDSKEQPACPQAESEYVRDRVQMIVGSIKPAFPPSVSLVLCEGNCDDSAPKSGFLWQRVSPPPPHSACCRTNALFPTLNGPAPNPPHANSSGSPRSSDHTAMRIEAIFIISTHIHTL